MGTIAGIPKYLQGVGAGFVELKKFGFTTSDYMNGHFYLQAPYGDNYTDYLWNTKGMNDAQNNIDHDPIYGDNPNDYK